ncbi:MAG TPA: ChaB family protein [Gemmatimonadaceae bacterium]|jgi:cation transport regulator|nr:ChaB family protein [Gemmatimonadaceae bacterium]
MPYASNSQLPPGVRDHLPTHAQDIYRAAYNHALTEYAGEGESAAHRVAWAAVEKKYEKRGDQWVAK